MLALNDHLIYKVEMSKRQCEVLREEVQAGDTNLGGICIDGIFSHELG